MSFSLVHFGYDVNATNFSFSSYRKRRELDDNGHILTNVSCFESIYKFILSISKYMKYRWAVPDGYCTSHVVDIVACCQFCSSSSGGTVSFRPSKVRFLYCDWSMSLPFCSRRSSTSSHCILWASSFALECDLCAHAGRYSYPYSSFGSVCQAHG